MSQICVDAKSAGNSYEPYWKRVVCADRVGLSLRADVREHIATAVRECGFKSLRQHGMFFDDLFVWPAQEEPFNFQYLDSVYDYYLSLGIRPFVELSFQPRWMASGDTSVFSVKCPSSPPADYRHWYTLVNTTVKHLVERYGLDEVRSWNFEVWNEPNIPFWTGTQEQYFELYRTSVEAVKSVDTTLRIGGPATSNFEMKEDGSYYPVWIDEFMAYCDTHHLPADFISTHPYPTDFPFDDATQQTRSMARERTATHTDLLLLRKLVDSGPFPQAEIHCDEWGSSPGVRDRVHDHPFSATFLLENLLGNLGLVDSLARWVISDISEERFPGATEFYGGWGLLSSHGLRKPGFFAYKFLNSLGGTMLHNSDGIAVTRSQDSWQVLLYNHHHFASQEYTSETIEGTEAMTGEGEKRTFSLALTNLPPRVRVTKRLLDAEHGWAQHAWVEMGMPAVPTPRQVDTLHDMARPSESVSTHLTDSGRLELNEILQPLGMMLIEIEKV